MTNEEITRFFNDSQAFIQSDPDLRDLQVERWFRTRQHFRNSSGSQAKACAYQIDVA